MSCAEMTSKVGVAHKISRALTGMLSPPLKSILDPPLGRSRMGAGAGWGLVIQGGTSGGTEVLEDSDCTRVTLEELESWPPDEVGTEEVDVGVWGMFLSLLRPLFWHFPRSPGKQHEQGLPVLVHEQRTHLAVLLHLQHRREGADILRSC